MNRHVRTRPGASSLPAGPAPVRDPAHDQPPPDLERLEQILYELEDEDSDLGVRVARDRAVGIARLLLRQLQDLPPRP